MASPQWLTRAADFEVVRREGKRVRTSALEIRTTASLRRQGRIGLIVPRHQHSAVERNRLKRRLREIVRTAWVQPLASRDIVVRATPAAYRASFDSLRADVATLTTRIDQAAS